jgi:hypothetical protein
MSIIKIDDSSVYTNIQNTSDKIDILEDSLADLNAKISDFKSKLKGDGYTGFFESIEKGIETQKTIIATYRVLLSDVHNYATDMVSAEQGVSF